MAARAEDLLLEVEGKIFLLEMEQLLQIAGVLKVPQKDISGKTKFQVIKLLSGVLEGLYDEESSEEFSVTIKISSPPPPVINLQLLLPFCQQVFPKFLIKFRPFNQSVSLQHYKQVFSHFSSTSPLQKAGAPRWAPNLLNTWYSRRFDNKQGLSTQYFIKHSA